MTASILKEDSDTQIVKKDVNFTGKIQNMDISGVSPFFKIKATKQQFNDK